MTIDEAIKIFKEIKAECESKQTKLGKQVFEYTGLEALNLAIKALEQQSRWIPVKWHTITEEEREHEGYPKEWVNHVDCVMPEDEQEILITIKGRKGNTWVEKDTCYIDDGFYLDSGYDWAEDVIAWMPLPQPYKEVQNERLD